MNPTLDPKSSVSAAKLNQEYGVVTEPGTLRLERLLPGPIERVWAYLVEPEKRRKWFAGGKMELRPQGAMELHFRHQELTRGDDEVPTKYCHTQDMEPSPGRVTRCDPPHVLAFEWEFCAEPSEVTFELRPEGEEVRLVLTHRRLQSNEDIVCVASGWHAHVGLLIDLLSGCERGSFWRTHGRLEKEYGERIGGVEVKG